MKIHLLLIPLTAFLGDQVNASSIEVSGEVSGHWSVDTVRVLGNLFLSSDQTLIIDPGVRVEFLGHFQFQVRGSILALGTAQKMIEFTCADTTGFSDTLTGSGGWYGFMYEHLDPSTDSSLFAYCQFRYGKAVSQEDTIGLYGGAFRILEFNRISFHQCLFEYNHAYRWGGAIYALKADIRVRECEFRFNESGRSVAPWGYGGAICIVQSNPEIVSNLFDQNRSTGIGGGASFEYADPVVMYNIFSANYSGLGGALGYLRSQPLRVCSNNLMYENEARFFGGAIACIAAHTVFVNNTVANNLAVYGGGFYCNDSAVPSNYNCLYYNNFANEGAEVYIWDIRSAPNFYSCNMPGDTSGFAGSGGHEGYHGEYMNNLDTVPDWAETGPSPFRIKASSPMKDAGRQDTSSLMIPEKDLAGEMRIYNHRIDIGAYEWNPGEVVHEHGAPGIQVILFPNPASDEIHIRFSLDKPVYVGISAFTLNGYLVFSRPPEKYETGTHQITWDLQGENNQKISSGQYLIQVETDNQTIHKVMIVLD